ncbi:flagellar M-ring protein FliF [Thiohalospira halophila DSM 15071]|uniref:Flagellar M-ring protein n=1 Tax=Thiohalospira halophila DSM 15071 TaxID=1123397 RepID=A0A1I1PMN0_9GAMM|nr:flagellar basal-body MS-ring/collar protein FliF [Thiohalospira halophila]SFD08908.1 flagellar M-ring protein FliF [Thiohalospira halophila DSM 15071]
MEMARAPNLSAQLEGFTRLPRSRQAGLVVGAAAILGIIIAVLLWSQQPSYAPLFTGLESKEAGEVAQVLEQEGIPYEVDSGAGRIDIPASDVHQTRIKLAAQGLPSGGYDGFEIMKQNEGFGVSQFMEQARYQRALEGELARSIMSMGTVEQARVHLAMPKDSVFIRDRKEPKASIVVHVGSGGSFSDEQVQAVTNLVASAIPALEADKVSVVNQSGELLSGRERDPEAAEDERQFNYVRRLERAYASRIENILQPVVGRDGVRAQVTAEVDFTETERTQELFNPDTAAVRSRQESRSTQRDGDAAGVPGSLSNEPPGAATAPEEVNPGEGGNGNGDSGQVVREDSTVNYELDRTITHSSTPAGALKRLSVAVVVDHEQTTNEAGEEVTVPRDEAEVQRIESLVRDAVGFDPGRGDSVNVVSASFAPGDDPTRVPWWEQPWVWDIAKQVVGAALVIFLILGVLRPVLRNLAQPPSHEPSEEEEDEAMAELERQKAQMQEELEREIQVADYETNLQTAKTLAQQDPKRVAQVVKSWIGSEE